MARDVELLETDRLRLRGIGLEDAGAILAANEEDLVAMDPRSPLLDRLRLDRGRLEGIAADMRSVAALPSPLGRTLVSRTLPNGLSLRKVSVPFGVIGVIYEARPNVTFDVFSLCFKSAMSPCSRAAATPTVPTAPPWPPYAASCAPRAFQRRP